MQNKSKKKRLIIQIYFKLLVLSIYHLSIFYSIDQYSDMVDNKASIKIKLYKIK